YGSALWAAQTVASGTGSAVRWYEFNTGTMSVSRTGTVQSAAHSYDFNPAIVARTDGTAFMTWSATNPAKNLLAAIMIAKLAPADTNFGPLRRVWTSPGVLGSNPSITSPGLQGWGYSGIADDPTHSMVYAANEYAIGGATGWGTKVVHFK